MPNYTLKDANNNEYVIKTYYSADVNQMEKLNPYISIRERVIDKDKDTENQKERFNNKDEAIKYCVKEIIDSYKEKYEANMKLLNSLRSKFYIIRNKILNNQSTLNRVNNFIDNTNKYKEIEDFYRLVLKGEKTPKVSIHTINNLINKIGSVPVGQKLYQLDYRHLTYDNAPLFSSAVISDFKIKYESVYLDIKVEEGYFPFKNIVINIDKIENNQIDILKGISNYSSIKYFTNKEDLKKELEKAKEILSLSNESLKL